MAAITSNFKIDAIMNAVFCLCFLFSASSFLTGALMLQPEFLLFEKAKQQWLGNHTNKYLYCVCNNLFFDISLTTAYRIKAAFKGQSYIVLYGKKQQTNRTPFETTDSS